MSQTDEPATVVSEDDVIASVNAFLEMADVDDLASIASRYCYDGPIQVEGHKGRSDTYVDGDLK